MRGVNKKIIEITDPDNREIEKVIVFLRPGSSVSVRQNKEAAQSYVAGLCCEKRGILKRGAVIAGALLLCAAVFLLLYFL